MVFYVTMVTFLTTLLMNRITSTVIPKVPTFNNWLILPFMCMVRSCMFDWVSMWMFDKSTLALHLPATSNVKLEGSFPFCVLSFFHNIIQPCGSVPWPWNMSIIFSGPWTKQECLFTIHTFKLTLGNFGWSYTPNTIHKKHYSSQ